MYSPRTVYISERRTFFPWIRKISDSKKEVVEKHQQVLVAACETGGLCQTALKPSRLLGASKAARSTTKAFCGSGFFFPNSSVAFWISSQNAFFGSTKMPLSFFGFSWETATPETRSATIRIEIIFFMWFSNGRWRDFHGRGGSSRPARDGPGGAFR
jgi:hypothetical protein